MYSWIASGIYDRMPSCYVKIGLYWQRTLNVWHKNAKLLLANFLEIESLTKWNESDNNDSKREDGGEVESSPPPLYSTLEIVYIMRTLYLENEISLSGHYIFKKKKAIFWPSFANHESLNIDVITLNACSFLK